MTFNLTIEAVESQQQFMTATGGTITTDGDYKVHTFNSSGTFTPIPGSDSTNGSVVEYLVIAGGGGAGGASSGVDGNPGSANTGGGAGSGANGGGGGAAGGSGVVIIRYKFQ